MSASNTRIAKNTVLLYIRMAFAMLVGLYTSRIVLAVLGVQDFGIYGVVGGVAMFFAFLNGAMSSGTSRFITFELGKGDFEQLRKTFCASLLNHVFIALFILLLAETIGLYFVNHKLVIPLDRMNAALVVYQISILTTLLSFLQTPYIAVITAHEKMNAFAAIGIADVCIKFFCVLLLKYVDNFDSLIFYSVLMLICSLVTTVLYIFYCKNKFDECKDFSLGSFALHKKLLIYSAWDLLGGFSGIAQGQGLNILLNLFFGPVVNAARGISVQIQGALGQFTGNFIMSVRPQIIKLYAEGKTDTMLKLTYSSAKYGFALIFLISLPIFFEMDYILSLWLVETPKHTANFCRIVILINLVNTLRWPFIYAIHATGHIQLGNLVCGPILIAVLPLSYVSLKMGYTPESVFFATLAINFLVQFIEISITKRYAGLKWKDYFRCTCLPSMLHFVIVGLLFYYIHRNIESSLLGLFVLCVCCSFLNGAGAYFLLASEDTKFKVRAKIAGLRRRINE